MNPPNICVPKQDVAVSPLLITNKYKQSHPHTCKSEIFTLGPKTIFLFQSFFLYKLTVSRIKNIYEGIVSFPLVFLVYKIREEAKQGSS